VELVSTRRAAKRKKVFGVSHENIFYDGDKDAIARGENQQLFIIADP
jgi:hypothetical protein